MSDKELEPGSDVPVVNAWDQPAGEASNKVLMKTIPGQPGTTSIAVEPIIQEEITPVVTDVPFVAPNISFDIPKSEPINPQAAVANVEPIVPIVQPVVNVEPVVPTVQQVVNVEPVAPIVQPVVNVEPVAPIVQPVVNVEHIEPIVQPVVEGTPAIKTFNDAVPIEGYSVATPENENVLPTFDMPEIVIQQKTPNPQQDIMNNDSIKDIPTVIKEAPIASENVSPEIKTMSAQELNQSFGTIINAEVDPLKDSIRKQGETTQIDSLPITGEMVEAYTEKSDNNFSNIFTNPTNTEETFFSPEEKTNLETQPGIPSSAERVELKRPDTNANYPKTKKRLYPAGWGIGIVIFIILLVFVMSIDQISLFFDNLFRN